MGRYLSSGELNITPEEFQNGLTLFAFDTTPDLCASDLHSSATQNSNISLEVKFSSALTSTINIILYSEFQSEIHIDKLRQVKNQYFYINEATLVHSCDQNALIKLNDGLYVPKSLPLKQNSYYDVEQRKITNVPESTDDTDVVPKGFLTKKIKRLKKQVLLLDEENKHFDCNGYKVTNLGNAENDTDAITVLYLRDYLGENSNQDITMFMSEEQDDFLKKFWELESVPSTKSLTREEISCEEKYINNLKILEDGRYSVGLPFRTLPTLGESSINALKRFLSLESKLQKSPSILKQYCDFMDEYLLINHMELIPSDELDTPSAQCYYIPHHCVFKEQSTTSKLKVVFDASCKTSNGKSLNDFLHVGPKLQQDIFNILIRFQTRPIAFSGDIEKMYRQVRIDSRDCDFQRILWRKNPSEPLLDNRLLTVTYGLSCVPYLAMRILHQLATDKVSTFPVASKIVQTDFYVDDLLSGADTIEEATCHIPEVNNLLSSAGISLRKWRLNVLEVLSGFSEQVEDRNNLRDFESDSCVKILGICWNPSLDIFQILVNDIPEQTNSKIHLMSHISRIFDPIGWLSVPGYYSS
ncbi:hypothetical protein LAZ67_21001677 [Cordylochernes scorpioides]|uniref:Reverse transcriptase domain-containing protein n=1 Tax=Cordylochernes scorpioides TaxID=51811 RepID=A0ABY6LP06_9ARAC|nr:hypothetical protein LAZ67_21001677 [Cordylochernes scorpioides]